MTTARINQYRAAVVAKLAETLPQLRSCDEQFGRFDLEELETTVIAAPAVRFAVLEANLKTGASEQGQAELRCAAFVITEGKGRNQESWAIGEAIAITAQNSQRWGLFSIGMLGSIKMAPVISANLKQRGVAIFAVEWRQDLHKLGENIFDDAGKLLEELYINGELVDLSEGTDNG